MGAGKHTAILIPEPLEPDLMYRMTDTILHDRAQLAQPALDWSQRKSHQDGHTI